MKISNMFGIIVLLSLLLAISGCGDDTEPLPIPAEDVSQDVVPDAGDGAVDVEEPVLPDDAVADVGSDVTEDKLSPDAGADEEASAGDEEDVVEDVTGDDGDELTAENYRVISMKDLHAYPEELHITVGTTVEWRNVNDNLQHIIGWRDQKSMGVTPEPILIGESWSYMFSEPMKVTWFSTARPTIQGTIYVDE